MTNRNKYILQANEYDMLIGLQAAIGSGMCQCVIEALIGRTYLCPEDRRCTLDTCKECIQEWLNEETE